MAKREKRNKSRGSSGRNRKTGVDFLEKNRKKEGVYETASGLQYMIIEEGNGNHPPEGCYVVSERKLFKIRNVSFGDIFIFLNSLMLRHHRISKKKNLIQNNSFHKIRQFPFRHYVVIHQRCLLLNGKVIEDTYKENEPDEVPMHELIEGYREGLMLMKKGGRSKFFIPPDLAWGKKGTGNKIPPNALLIFDVRLLDFR